VSLGLGSKPPAREPGPLILVVEDDPSARELAEVSLRCQGYEVISASDGAQGLMAFTRNRDSIRAVVTDAVMPVMDGVQMVRAIRALDPHVAIISVSGCPDPEVVAAYEALKVTAFLPKPYRLAELVRILAEATRDKPTSG
jgi:two-component system, cell cycle sensor histidine kinase and response regulator CckA